MSPNGWGNGLDYPLRGQVGSTSASSVQAAGMTRLFLLSHLFWQATPPGTTEPLPILNLSKGPTEADVGQRTVCRNPAYSTKLPLVSSKISTVCPTYINFTSENWGKPPQYKPQPVNKRRATRQVMKKKASTGRCASLLRPQITANKTRIKPNGRPRATVCPSMKRQK